MKNHLTLGQYWEVMELSGIKKNFGEIREMHSTYTTNNFKVELLLKLKKPIK